MGTDASDVALRLAAAGVVARCLGLGFPAGRLPDLERGLGRAAADLSLAGWREMARSILADGPTDAHVAALATHLTVGETHFFREPRAFEALEGRLLPELIAARRRSGQKFLRLWSAGCSTGEEAYSLAILLHRLLPDPAGWSVSVLATDVNPGALERARAGVYGQWSFRGTPDDVRERYFRPAAGGREVLPEVRGAVTFARMNLLESSRPESGVTPGQMDLILCRNVLMYFAPDRAVQAAENLHRALAEDGLLLVSAAEQSHDFLSGLAPFRVGDITFYRRPGAGTSSDLALSEGESHGTGLPQAPVAVKEPERGCGPGAPDGREALAHYHSGRLTAAAECAREALAAFPRDPKLPGLLARIHADLGSLPEALEWCDRSLALDRLNPALYYLRATILMESGRGAEAAVDLRRTVYLDPGMAVAHYALGELCRREGRQENARLSWRNALDVLRDRPPDEPLPEGDGLTAGGLAAMIERAGTLARDRDAGPDLPEGTGTAPRSPWARGEPT